MPLTAKEPSEVEWAEQQLSIFWLLSEKSSLHPAPNSQVNLHHLITKSASKYGLDDKVLASIVLIESNGNPCALSPKGAKGLGQLMDATASMLGVRDAFQPQQNLAGTASYFARQLTATKGNLRLAAAAYNHGPRAIRKSYWPAETRSYVRKFQQHIRRFQSEDWQAHLPQYIPMTNRAACKA